MKHPLLKQLILPIVVMIAAVVLMVIPSGNIIKEFLPCIQDPGNSFPCQHHYTLIVFVMAGAIFLLALLTAIIKIILYKKTSPSKKKSKK